MQNSELRLLLLEKISWIAFSIHQNGLCKKLCYPIILKKPYCVSKFRKTFLDYNWKSDNECTSRKINRRWYPITLKLDNINQKSSPSKNPPRNINLHQNGFTVQVIYFRPKKVIDYDKMTKNYATIVTAFIVIVA